MPRASCYEIVVDAGLFTPTQLQAVAVGRIGFQAGTRWLRDHVCSHRTLITEHQVGLVLWAWQLEYERPLRFQDADDVVVDVTGRVRGPRSSQFEVSMTISGPRGVVARSTAASVPLRLVGDPSLSGTSAGMPDSLVAQFRDDERERSPFRSRVPGLRAALERTGREIGSTTTTFRVHGHHCEMADQWYWVESLGFAAAAREELVRLEGGRLPDLRRAQARGIRSVDATWLRTGQLWDLLEVRTTGYRVGDEVAFVHELGLAETDSSGPCAVMVERT